jgi:hypothetical protein
VIVLPIYRDFGIARNQTAAVTNYQNTFILLLLNNLNMRQFRFILAGVSFVVLVSNLFFIDYQDLISKSNLGPFLGIISMSFTFLAMILTNRDEAKHSNNK